MEFLENTGIKSDISIIFSVKVLEKYLHKNAKEVDQGIFLKITSKIKPLIWNILAAADRVLFRI